MSVIESESKFKDKSTVDKFIKLMGLIEKNEAAILQNPIKYLDMASKEIAEAKQKLRSVQDALFPGLDPVEMFSEPTYEPLETIVVTKKDYDCLCAARSILTNLNGL